MPTTTNMVDPMIPSAESGDALFDYASFLATAARGSLEEGVFVASLRLIDAISRLACETTNT